MAVLKNKMYFCLLYCTIRPGHGVRPWQRTARDFFAAALFYGCMPPLILELQFHEPALRQPVPALKVTKKRLLTNMGATQALS